MKFKCNKCEVIKDIFRFKLSYNEDLKKLVNNDAICCDIEMECITENEGMPTIIRNEYTHEDRIIQHKAKQREARLKKDGYDKYRPNE